MIDNVSNDSLRGRGCSGCLPFAQKFQKFQKVDQNSQTEFPNGKCAFHLLAPGLLAWIAFDPIFREKVVEMKRAHPCENFHLAFDAFHLLQLSTKRFFRVNGEQPL